MPVSKIGLSVILWLKHFQTVPFHTEADVNAAERHGINFFGIVMIMGTRV